MIFLGLDIHFRIRKRSKKDSKRLWKIWNKEHPDEGKTFYRRKQEKISLGRRCYIFTKEHRKHMSETTKRRWKEGKYGIT